MCEGKMSIIETIHWIAISNQNVLMSMWLTLNFIADIHEWGLFNNLDESLAKWVNWCRSHLSKFAIWLRVPWKGCRPQWPLFTAGPGLSSQWSAKECQITSLASDWPPLSITDQRTKEKLARQLKCHQRPAQLRVGIKSQQITSARPLQNSLCRKVDTWN